MGRKAFSSRVRGVLACAVLAGAVLGAGAPAGAAVVPGAATNLPVTATSITITMRDGVQLVGVKSVPTGVAGPLPLVVVPGTYGADTLDATPVVKALSARGYAAVTYYERGFRPSTGFVKGGDVEDLVDVSEVITWALANLPADPDRVGLAGLSYGGGISLMSANVDPRVKVAASLSGWTDLNQTFYVNDTQNRTVFQILYALAQVKGTPGPELTAAYDAAQAGDDAKARAWGAGKGADWWIPFRGNRKPGLYVSEPMNETIFPTTNIQAYFEKYPGPKKFEFVPGDHAVDQGTDTMVPAGNWPRAFRFIDAFLGGDTKVLSEPAASAIPRSASGSGSQPRETYASTLTANTSTKRLALNTPAPGFLGMQGDGTLSGTAGTATRTLRDGTNWVVHTGIVLFSGAAEVASGTPPLVQLALADRGITGVWRTPALTSGLKIRGNVTPRLQLTPSHAKGSIVVHVLDEDETGLNVYNVAQQPYTWTGKVPGQPFTLSFPLPFNAYDIKPGHKLVVTVSTDDTTFANNNPDNATVKIGPASVVDVPVK